MTFEDTLATWLVKQRWFAGKGRTVHDLAVVADTEIIPGDPGLRHLMVTVSHGATSDRYQLFIGYRARLPARLRHARIGALDGLQIYDGLHDTALTRALLDAIVDDRSVGMLRFCRVPGAPIEAGLDSLVLTGEQSNTSLVFGESAIFKVFRRVNPGPNPDLEVASALAELGSSHIAEPFGWVETRIDGASTVLAILSRYLRAASDGWALAATSVRDLYASEGEPASPLAQRRARSSPLRDVAGMLRSFDYAARHQLVTHPEAASLAPRAADWVRRNSDAFCAGYAAAGGLDPAENSVLLRAMLLDKAVYEVIYEARNRPTWVPIPLESIAEL